MRTTWQPYSEHGDRTSRDDLPDSVFAYPEKRKEPLTDASHVRGAIARFEQVTDVSDEERSLAFANIQLAANHFNVDISIKDWHDVAPRTGPQK